MTTTPSAGRPGSQRTGPRVFMMDLWAIVPYYTAYLSRALLAGGADVRIGSITYYLDPECFRSRGLRTQPGLLDIVGRFRLPPVPRRALKLIEALLNLIALAVEFLFRPPEIVHVQFLPTLRWPVSPELLFLRFCRARGARIVLTVHDLLPHDTADRYRELFRQLYRFVDSMICHSESVKGRLVTEFGIDPARIAVIPHGPFFYDLPPASAEPIRARFNVPADAKLVLWQGILFPYKGVDVLLEAWKDVEAVDPGAFLVIAGTGSPSLLAAMDEQTARLGLTRVRTHPHFLSTGDLVALYRTAQVVVYPYRAITTSGALATGLALGKAVVATNLSVFRELLTDRVNALLVPPGDPEALAAAILQLTQNDVFREELEASVRSLAFGDRSWKKIASLTVLAYLRKGAARVGNTRSN